LNSSDIFSPKVYFYRPFSKAAIHLSAQFCTEVSEEYFITEIGKICILTLLLEFCQQWSLEMVEIMFYTKFDVEETKQNTLRWRSMCKSDENIEWKLTETGCVDVEWTLLFPEFGHVTLLGSGHITCMKHTNFHMYS
jgi:hypothetical protein